MPGFGQCRTGVWRSMAGAPGVNPITPALFDFLRELREDNDLYLFVKPSGARSWIQRLVIRGRRRDFGLGSVALVSLAEAREKARANRKLAREGGDPLTERRPRPEHADLRRNRRTGGGAEAVRLAQSEPGPRLDGECAALRLARIGRMPVSEVTSGDVLGILSPIWHVKACTARLVRSASARSWSGPWRWNTGPTTLATASCRCSVHRMSWCGTCGSCRIARWLRPSGRCGPRTRCPGPCWPSSSWC